MLYVIRQMDRFYEAHPTISFLIAICCAFAIMEIAHQWDREDSAALRIQWVANTRGAV